MDNIANMYICNNQRLMINYIKKLIKVEKSIADRVLLSEKKIKIRVAKKNS